MSLVSISSTSAETVPRLTVFRQRTFRGVAGGRRVRRAGHFATPPGLAPTPAPTTPSLREKVSVFTRAAFASPNRPGTMAPRLKPHSAGQVAVYNYLSKCQGWPHASLHATTTAPRRC